jgi:hypothetical protein
MNKNYQIPSDADFLRLAQSIEQCFPINGEQSRPDDAASAIPELKKFVIDAIDRAISQSIPCESNVPSNEQETP